LSALLDKTKRLFYVRKQFLRRLAWVGVIGFLCWGFYKQIGNALLRPIVQNRIEQLTDADVRIESIDFKAAGFVRVNYLVIRPKDKQYHKSPILNAKTVDIRFSLAGLLKLQPTIKEIALHDFTLNACYDVDNRQWNLASLNIKKSTTNDQPLPIIKVNTGKLKLSRLTAGNVEDIFMVNIKGTFAAARGAENTYGFYIGTDIEHSNSESLIRGIWQPGGKLKLNGRISMVNLPVFGNTWTMDELAVELDYDRSDIALHRLEWKMGGETTVSIRGVIKDYLRRPEYALKMQLKDLLLTPRPSHDALVYCQPLLDKLGPNLRKFLELYNPEAIADVDVESTGRFGELAKSKWSGTIDCKDASVRYEKFPYLFEHISGRIKLADKNIVLDNLNAVHGNVRLNINGFLEGIDRRKICDIQITSPNMLLDEDLYRALNTKQKKLWFSLTPSGLAKIDYRFTISPDDGKKTFLTLELLDAKAVYQRFPYPLTNLKGKLSIEPDTIILSNVVSRHLDRRIAIDGRITGTDTDTPKYDILIIADNVPIDSTLKLALPPDPRRFYENFDVDAVTDVNAKIFCDQAGSVRYTANVGVKATSLIYDRLAIPLTDVQLDAVLMRGRTIIKQMTARSGTGRFFVSGTIWPANRPDTDTGFCLLIWARQLQLSDQWLRQLPKETSEIFSRLRPSGVVNVAADLNINLKDTDCPPYKIVIDCLANRLDIENFGSPIENIRGKVVITDDKVELRNMTATTVIDNSSSGRFRQSMLPIGQIDLNIEQATLFRAGDGEQKVDFSGKFDFKNCSVAGKEPYVRFDASLTARALYKIGTGFLQAEAGLNCASLKIHERSFDNLFADISYDPVCAKFISREFVADCYGGKVIGDIELSPSDTGGVDYLMRLTLNNVLAGDFLGSKFAQPADSNSTSGRLNASLNAFGTLGLPNAATGRLKVNISGLKLARRSLTGKVLGALQLSDPDDYIFNDISADAYLKNNNLVFDNLYLSGRSTVLKGRGRLNLQTNQVDLVFNTFGGELTSSPSFLESLAKGLGAAVTKVEVTGHINSPTIKTTTLPIIEKPFGILGTKR